MIIDAPSERSEQGRFPSSSPDSDAVLGGRGRVQVIACRLGVRVNPFELRAPDSKGTTILIA
jgi:hypothetical protein